MFKNYLTITLRNLMKYKGYSILNTLGLAVGVAVCLLIMLFVQDELSYDTFHGNADNLYVATFSNGSTTTPTALADYLKTEYPEVKNTSRFMELDDGLLSSDGKPNKENGAVLADPGFLKMFTIQFLSGDKNTALNDPNSILISRKLAAKYFGSKNAVGKTLTFGKAYPLTVKGVFENYPVNSHLKFEYIMPFSLLKDWGINLENWDINVTRTYVQMQPDISIEKFGEKISGAVEKHRQQEKRALSLQLVTRMHLYNFDETVGPIKYVYIFSAMAIFVLLIGCINFMNLTTAKSARRSKEVGLRKAIGANRNNLVVQFFIESFLLTTISIFIGIIFSIVLLPVFNNITGKLFTYQSLFERDVILGIIGITIITGFLAGSYPALFLSRFNPIKVLRGTLNPGMKGITFRKVLVITQFSISIFLLVGTLTIYKQINYMRDKDLGLNKNNIIFTTIGNKFKNNFETIKTEMLKNPNILDVTLTNIAPYKYSVNAGEGDVNWEGKTDQAVKMVVTSVDYDYLKTFDLKISSGRFFSKDYSGDLTDALVINEAAVKAMGMDSPIGKKLEVLNWKGKIIGVVKDFHFESLRSKILPMVMKIDPGMNNQLCVRINPKNTTASIAFLHEKWNEIYPENPFEYSFLDETIRSQYNIEEKVGETARYFTILALMISCFGLLGLASYATEQRKKEIGIRKTLGATVTKLVFLLSKEFTKWVLFANLIAWPAAYIFAQSWLKDFEYRAELSVWIFLVSGLSALIIALLSVGYQAIKAAITNPVNSLRSDV